MAEVLHDGTYTLLAHEVRAAVHRSEGGARFREIATDHGGLGVGAALAFRSAVDAVRCAIVLQESASPADLAIGLDAGEVHADHAVHARPVAVATKLAGVASGGQVLVSALVRELASDELALPFGPAREIDLVGRPGRLVVHEVLWGGHRPALRVVIADDAALVRDGVAALLRENDVDVVAAVRDASELHQAVARHLPDVALIDIRMPPSFTDEGLVAAERIRAGYPNVGVLVLSQHLDARYAVRVAEASPARTGYLLKDRVTDSRLLFDALERIASGGCVIDAAVAEGLVARASALARIDALTEREREVLALVAEGLSNRAIAARLVVTQKTVEAHIGQIFLKLGLRDVEGEDRRVAAVLTFLRAADSG